MKQRNLSGDQFKAEQNEAYTGKIESPVYKPGKKKPHILQLVDKSKTHRLIREIKSSAVSEEEKLFLIDAATRHNRFFYSKIADYYAHSTGEMQQLMEKSGLVIIDFENAIEYGFAKLTEEISKLYGEDYGTE